MKIGAVDVGGTNIFFGVFEDDLLLEKKQIPAEADKGKDVVIKKLKDVMKFFKEKGVSRVGVGMPGLVDHNAGVVEIPPNIEGWIKENLKMILQKDSELEVYVINDANAYVLGEWKFGAGRGKKDVVLLTLGTGVGGGIVSGGKLLLGKTHAAGEVGHIVINPSGPLCKCGQRGCLEAYIGNKYFEERALYMKKKFPDSLLNNYTKITPRIIAECAKKGDRLSTYLWNEFGHILGVGLVTLIHIFDPEIIILGGGISKSFDLFINSTLQVLENRVMSYKKRGVEVVLAQLGDEAPLYGAYYFALVKGNVEDSGH